MAEKKTRFFEIVRRDEKKWFLDVVRGYYAPTRKSGRGRLFSIINGFWLAFRLLREA